MSMIKFNGVRKVPGRPTLVEGSEGRRYVASKILKNLENSHRGGCYDAYTGSVCSSPYAYTPGQALSEFDYGLDQNGFSSEPLNDNSTERFNDSCDDLDDHIEPYYEEFHYDENHCYVSTFDDGEQTTSQNLVWVQDGDVESDMSSRAGTMKTSILRVPTSGVVRSSRGTVELLVHANGLAFQPIYNLCGMLIGVNVSDGRRLEKSVRGDWRLINSEGMASSEKIETVSFDKKGNLWYQTAKGKRVTFFADGRVETFRQIS